VLKISILYHVARRVAEKFFSIEDIAFFVMHMAELPIAELQYRRC